ncbi:MAG TPA: NAD(P)/FAD-dependent oxidoreductase [Ignavibacteriaceae bacterium]|nr:NAD(P)/FAD-dependent oxidoreductase [Ignavibacteriaceae bacterium]
MNSFHIVVIGNSETALVCSLTAQKTYPDKKVALIINSRRNEFINRLFNSGSFNNGDNGVVVMADEVITRNENVIGLMGGEEINFEKLVVATGSVAIQPHIEGVDKEDVYFINKDPDDLLIIKNRALDAENIVIYGGGYIGVVMTDELLHEGKNVTLVERTNRLLPSSIDLEVSKEAKNILEAQGGRIIFKSKVRQVFGNKKISGVRLRDGEVLGCDYLIICCGERPETKLAEKFGLVYDNDRGILVDEYQRTSDKNIFAVGECAARFDFFCGDLSDFTLSTTRLEEAKLIGSNLYSVIYNRGRLNDYISERNNIRTSIQKSLKSSDYINIKQFIDTI